MSGSPAARLRPEVEALARMILRVSTYYERPDVLSADAGVMMVQHGLGLGVLYLDDGWKQLTDALRAVIAEHGGSIRTHTAVRQVRSGDQTAEVELMDGTVLQATAAGDCCNRGGRRADCRRCALGIAPAVLVVAWPGRGSGLSRVGSASADGEADLF